MPESEKSSVMVVDDTPSNIDILLEILGEEYNVRVAVDGPLALEAMAHHPPDIVLLDIMMPGMDGYEVCTRLKADDRTRDIPVIFVTARGADGDEVRGFGCGAVDYITKPVSAPVVRARVAAHLALSQASRILAEKNQALEENIQLREDVERISRHDLKTPLNKIVSLPRILMEDDTIGAGFHESLKRIEQAGLTMLEMINRSLDLVKMERGTYGFEAVAVDLPGVLERVASDLKGLASQKGCEIKVASASQRAQGLLVQGDELLCYSMAANLLKNALEACPEHSRVMVGVQEAGPGRAQLWIRNPGMVPQAVRDHFFEKYATAGKEEEPGLAPILPGSWPGPWGDISMTTGPEQGTRICVTLRLAQEDARAWVPEGGEDQVPEIRLPHLKLLIADDDADNLSILSAFLDHPSLDVHRAENGRQALELWQSLGHDLVFMDVEMPVMDGMTAVRQIRKTEESLPGSGRPTGIFALSAHGEAMAQTCMDEGCDGYLTKPVSRGALLRAIQAWSGKENQGLPLAPEAESEPHGDRVEIDKDLEQIIPVFMENKAEQIRQLLDCISQEDLEGVRRIAHKLKGGFNMYGIASLGGICADIEQAAAKGETGPLPRLGQEVDGRFRGVTIIFR